MRRFPFYFCLFNLFTFRHVLLFSFAVFNVSKLSDRLLARGLIIYTFMCSFRPGSGDHLSGRGVESRSDLKV